VILGVVVTVNYLEIMGFVLSAPVRVPTRSHILGADFTRDTTMRSVEDCAPHFT